MNPICLLSSVLRSAFETETAGFFPWPSAKAERRVEVDVIVTAQAAASAIAKTPFLFNIYPPPTHSGVSWANMWLLTAVWDFATTAPKSCGRRGRGADSQSEIPQRKRFPGGVPGLISVRRVVLPDA